MTLPPRPARRLASTSPEPKADRPPLALARKADGKSPTPSMDAEQRDEPSVSLLAGDGATLGWRADSACKQLRKRRGLRVHGWPVPRTASVKDGRCCMIPLTKNTK